MHTSSSWILETYIGNRERSHTARISIDLDETLLANPACIFARVLIDDWAFWEVADLPDCEQWSNHVRWVTGHSVPEPEAATRLEKFSHFRRVAAPGCLASRR